MDVFIGTIVVWPITWAPDYFALCQGQQLQVNQYQALYSLIGQIYGGSGTASFNLPNLIGRAPIGTGSSTWGGVLQVAQTFGSATGTVTLNGNNLPAHTHAASFAPSTGSQPVTLPAVPPSGSLSVAVGVSLNAGSSGAGVPPSGSNVYLGGIAAKTGNSSIAFTGPYDSNKATASASLAGVSASVSSAGYSSGSPAVTTSIQAVTGGQVTIAAAGLGQPFSINNLQPSLVMNFLMALQGIYPARP